MGLSIEARFLEPEIPAELDATYRRTFNRLKGLFRARGCTPEEAADLAQEAAMRAYMHVQRWGVSGEGLDPLINRIARNLLIDRHRRVTPYLVPLENAAEVHDPGADPPEEIIRRQRSHEVRTAVEELPDRHQTALRYSMKGMTPAEVGDQLGIGRNAADALLHRARRSLRERLRHIGEGALGITAWVRLKASKVNLHAPFEAVGAATIPATLATAAVIATAISAIGNPSATATPTPRAPIVAAAPAAAFTESAPATALPGGTSGQDESETITVGPSTVQRDRHSIKTDTSVDDPTEPDRKVLGVGPDVIHEDDEASATGAVAKEACEADQEACEGLYEDPSQDPPARIKKPW